MYCLILCGQARHHVGGKQFERSQGFGEREIAEGELSNQVVDPRLLDLRFKESRDGGGTAGDALADLDKGVQFCRPLVGWRAAAQDI